MSYGGAMWHTGTITHNKLTYSGIFIPQLLIDILNCHTQTTHADAGKHYITNYDGLLDKTKME